jgi:hypothetical protein
VIFPSSLHPPENTTQASGCPGLALKREIHLWELKKKQRSITQGEEAKEQDKGKVAHGCVAAAKTRKTAFSAAKDVRVRLSQLQAAILVETLTSFAEGGMDKGAMEAYKEFVLRDPTIVSRLESTLRTLSYIIPGACRQRSLWFVVIHEHKLIYVYIYVCIQL